MVGPVSRFGDGLRERGSDVDMQGRTPTIKNAGFDLGISKFHMRYSAISWIAVVNPQNSSEMPHM